MGTRSSLVVRQWDIWEVIWLHEDGTSKARPGLAMMPTPFNARARRVPFLKISSVRRPDPNRFDIKMSDPTFPATGLRKDSYIYLGLVQSVDKSRILRPRGSLPPFSAAVLTMRIQRAVPGWSPAGMSAPADKSR